MFVTSAQTGGERKRRALPFHFPFAGTPRSYCGRSRAPYVTRQIDFARTAFAAGVPVWGSC
jgi:hypothetical protein